MSFKTVIIVAISCTVFSIVTSQSLTPLKPVTSVELHDNITLECRINQQVVGRFLWYHDQTLAFYNTDDSIFVDRYKVAVTDQVSRLTITNIHFEDRGEWKCEVVVGQSKEDTATRLVIKSPPQWYNVTQQKDITLPLGGSVELYCDAVGDPTPVVTWTGSTGAGGIVLPDRTVTEFYVGSLLKLANVTGMHHGKYKCHASNGLEKGISQEFTVKVPSKPYVTVYASTVRAPVNRTFQIGCTAHSHPQITNLGSVSWFKGSTRIENNVDDYKYSISPSNDGLTSISVLTTPKIDNTVIGAYRCQFTNNQGTASETVTLEAGAATDPDAGASRSGAPSTIAVVYVLLSSFLYAAISFKL